MRNSATEQIKSKSSQRSVEWILFIKTKVIWLKTYLQIIVWRKYIVFPAEMIHSTATTVITPTECRPDHLRYMQSFGWKIDEQVLWSHHIWHSVMSNEKLCNWWCDLEKISIEANCVNISKNLFFEWMIFRGKKPKKTQISKQSGQANALITNNKHCDFCMFFLTSFTQRK